NEDALDNFNPGNVPGIEGSDGNPEGGQTTTATFTYAQLLGLVDVGADEEIKFSLNANIEGTDTGVDSKDADVLWNYVDATHAQGETADGRVVFTLVQTAGTGTADPADDVWTFTLVDQVDHEPNNAASGDADKSVTVDVGDAFVATDFDGDAVDLSGTISVAIENDVPRLADVSALSATVNEDALDNFNPGNVPGIEGSDGNPEGGQTTTATFTYAQLLGLVDVGADEEIKFSLNANIEGTDT